MYQRIETACAAALLVAIVLLVGIAAVSRSAGSPIIWSIEVAQLMFVWLVVLAADIAFQQGRHFGLSMLLDRLPPRARQAADILNILIIAGLLIFLLSYAYKNVELMHPRRVGAMRLHGSYYHAALLVGFCLWLRTLAFQLFQRVRAGAA
ncbi:TRAP transporter small permease [Acuticoccus kandeliae]|uniref:TRAP transporter small permease n=1 Tax=Acuticoccus kandeliae TaxID=2073160 RepID=UPI000D3E1816|nr:TRAP transporter small permease [Acuticoccus kandeliae]